MAQLKASEPDRTAELSLEAELYAEADPGLLRIVLENLLGNAWKFTSKASCTRIELGRTLLPEGRVFFVRDNGAGFRMSYADKLFRPFQRLHTTKDFPGTGIGLATVFRAIDRHGGRVWAESAVGQGTSFFFTLSRKQGGEK